MHHQICRPLPNEELVWTADGVSDGGSNAEDVAGGEHVGVIQDVVVMCFGADENVSPNVIAQADASIHQEVVAAGVARAEVGTADRRLEAVEAGRLPADAAHQVKANFFADAGLIHPVKVKKDGTVGDAKAVEVALSASPDGVKTEAVTLMEDDVGTKIGIDAAFFGAVDLSRGCIEAALVGAGRQRGAESDHGIALLGGRLVWQDQAGQDKKRKNGCKEGKLSQEEPPVILVIGGKMLPPNHLDASAWVTHSS
jgi:hypothetical protein